MGTGLRRRSPVEEAAAGLGAPFCPGPAPQAWPFAAAAAGKRRPGPGPSAAGGEPGRIRPCPQPARRGTEGIAGRSGPAARAFLAVLAPQSRREALSLFGFIFFFPIQSVISN